MKNLTPLLFLFFISVNINAQNQAPFISNLTADVDYSNNTITLSYDLEDNENDSVEIMLQASDNDGQTYTINTSSATGDIGFPINAGMGKQIVWTAPNLASNYKIRLIADDLQPIDIQSIVDQVDSTLLWNDLGFLEGIRHRVTGNDLLNDTRDLMEQRFLNYEINTYRHEVNFNGYLGQNIIGDLYGKTEKEKVIIIDGHYDSVDDSPGTDDNATAVAGVLEAARILSNYGFEKTIRFIGFDLEEEGLVGSSGYVSTGIPTYETIEGVINLEMIGYYDDTPNSQTFPVAFGSIFPDAQALLEADSFRGNFISNISLAPMTAIGDAFHSAANTYVPDLKVIDIENPAGLLIPDLWRSDHAPFWSSNIPALMINDGANFRNPYYHTDQDTRETLNQPFFTNVVKASVATLAELAGIRNCTSVTVDILSNTEELNCAIQFFPNPVDEFIQLSFGNCLDKNLTLQLFDVSGFLILEKNISNQNQSLSTINTHPLQAGMYFLKIGNENSFITKKIIAH